MENNLGCQWFFEKNFGRENGALDIYVGVKTETTEFGLSWMCTWHLSIAKLTSKV